MSDLPLFPRLDITAEARPLVQVVPVKARPAEDVDIPDRYRNRLFVDVIHDGDWVPKEFLVDRRGGRIEAAQLQEAYVRERDWGASYVAAQLAARLGLGSFARVSVARVLMDFGRFPGRTPRNADHLHRFAINYPFSELLSYRQKKRVLESYYDEVSNGIEALIEGKLIKIAVHTYDRYNESGTERPAVSLMTRSIGYQTESEMPAGLFDPLYPDILAEFTADRILRDRISLTLGKARVPVAHNYPYCLPEGSLEVRYQVWAYFHYLQRRFEAEHPETRDEQEFRAVWQMLLDTNLRSSESEALRSYLHMYRRAPVGFEEFFQKAARAYERLVAFCDGQGTAIVDKYRFSPERTSSIAIEVRKDLVCEFGADGAPLRLRGDHVARITDAIAAAVILYLNVDHETAAEADMSLERHDAWYVDARR